MKPVQKQEVVYRLVGVKIVVRGGGWRVLGSSWWGGTALANLWVGVALRSVAAVGGTVRMEPVGVQPAAVTPDGYTFVEEQGLVIGLSLLLAIVCFVHFAVEG